MSPFSRREFLKSSLAAGTLTSVGTLSLHAASRTATDIVTLGKSGMKVTRLAFGTGSNNGYVQAALGQQEFTRLIHYAYDRGIRFFETAESYATPAMLGEALKGIPRESYQLMNKVTTDEGVDPRQRFDEMRRISQTEYFDIMLLHWQHTPQLGGPHQPLARRHPRSAIEKDHPHAGSIGPWPARAAPDARQPMAGSCDDPHEPQRHAHGRADYRTTATPANVREVVEHVKQVKSEGMGVISMKLVGDGTFTRHEDRQAAMRFAFNNAGVDCVTVGFKNTQEIDEAIDNLNIALT